MRLVMMRGPGLRSILFLTALVVAGAAWLSMTGAAHAAISQEKICWGVTLAAKGKYGDGCSTAASGVPAHVEGAYKVEAWSPQHSVCIILNGSGRVCSGGPEQKVIVTGEICNGCANFVTIANNAGSPSTVYGWTYRTGPGSESGGGGGGGTTPPPPGPEGHWFLRNSNSTGAADLAFLYGGGELLPVSGDWNGDGIDTPGAYDPATGQWFLRNSNTEGGGEISFVYGGGAGMLPVVGDWNGDGIDTVGLYKPATGEWFLRNSNTAGGGEINFVYGGGATTVPIAGDWNGDGIDTIGIVNVHASSSDEWFLRNSNTAGAGEISFTYGSGTELLPVVGDWNGDGIDTPGLFGPASGNWFLRNSNTGGSGEVNFVFGGGAGANGYKAIAGDWNGDGFDTVGFVH
jgi:hypothetical protein